MVHEKHKQNIPVSRIKKQAIAAIKESRKLDEKKKFLLGKEGQQKGREAEDRFLKAWEVRDSFVLSVTSRRATLHEDHYEKTDAWVEIKGYEPFRIQIKARHVKKIEQHEFRCNGIILVGVHPENKYEKIREDTLKQIRYLLNTERKKITF